MVRIFLAAVIALSSAPTVARPGDGPGAETVCDAKARSDALFEAFLEEYQHYVEGTHGAKTDEEARSFRAPDGTAYAAKFMKIAREHPEGPVAAEALSRAIQVDFAGPHWGEVIGLLGRRHVRSPGIDPVLTIIAHDTRSPGVESFLRAVLRENPSETARAYAGLGLALHLLRLAEEVERLRERPDRFERAAQEFGREEMSRFRDRNPSALRQEAESLLDRVVEESADVPGDGGLSPSEAASAMLFEIRALAVGEVAPEIEGEDLDGIPMRLSEERGKVVALVWWASWCGPCMEMVSHELELIDRMNGRPFVLLGVNGDEDRGRMRHQMEERGITWRSWADGGPHGPISTQWNVRSWPTIYVIDPDGVIRYRGGRDAEALDRAVDSVLEEVEGARGVVTVD